MTSSLTAAAYETAEAGGCQRWRSRRASYRPPGERFDPTRHQVELIDESTAKAFCIAHHYSGTYPAARLRVGLLRKEPFNPERLVGVAVFSVPMTNSVIPHHLPGLAPDEGVELGRFVLLDHVEANAESWTVTRAMRKACEELRVQGVLAYCDPLPRVDAYGQTTKRGHTGIIYRASNARYVGRSSARTLRMLPNGHIASERALGKLRLGERGAAYVERQLVAAGAPRRAPFEDGAAYIARLKRDGVLRSMRHPGNLAFTWRFDRHTYRLEAAAPLNAKSRSR